MGPVSFASTNYLTSLNDSALAATKLGRSRSAAPNIYSTCHRAHPALCPRSHIRTRCNHRRRAGPPATRRPGPSPTAAKRLLAIPTHCWVYVGACSRAEAVPRWATTPVPTNPMRSWGSGQPVFPGPDTFSSLFSSLGRGQRGRAGLASQLNPSQFYFLWVIWTLQG